MRRLGLLLVLIPSLSAAQSPPKTAADIVQSVSRATVEIYSTRSDGRQFSGSGFSVDSSGTIITNLHVVEGSSSIEVRFPSDEVFPVIGVKAVDRRRDIAIVQIGGFKIPVVALGDSDLVRPADRVMVIGNPLGLENSVTAGIISGVRDWGGYRILQMDAAISSGNSGGPVINERGQVIGIATAYLKGGQNLNIAVPVNYARGLLSLPVTAGLAMLSSPTTELAKAEPTPSSETSQPRTPPPFPELWRSTATGDVKSIRIVGDRVYVDNFLSRDMRKVGAESSSDLKRDGAQWVGVHKERVSCRTRPLTRRKLCPVLEFPITITLLQGDRIEGFGEEPINSSAFDCRHCTFVDAKRNRPFTWLPAR
jgi:serine protease Do